MSTDKQPNERPTTDGNVRFSMKMMLVGVAFAFVLFACAKLFMDAVTAARRAAIDSTAQSPLNQLMLALVNYEEVHGCFPPAYIADKNGKPMHSWRVLILPYVDHPHVYDAYNFNEPWNGPNNRKLANQMPRIFHSPSEADSNSLTNIVAIVGPKTVFPGAKSTKLADFADGRENTILLTEIANSKILWLEPRDLSVDNMSFKINDQSRPSISAASWRQPYVVFADNIHAYRVSDAMPPDSLKALTTVAGGEAITRKQLVSEGLLD